MIQLKPCLPSEDKFDKQFLFYILTAWRAKNLINLDGLKATKNLSVYIFRLGFLFDIFKAKFKKADPNLQLFFRNFT